MPRPWLDIRVIDSVLVGGNRRRECLNHGLLLVLLIRVFVEARGWVGGSVKTGDSAVPSFMGCWLTKRGGRESHGRNMRSELGLLSATRD